MAINTVIPNVIGGEVRALPLNQNADWSKTNDIDLQAQITANDVDIANRYTKAEVDALDANLQSQVTINKNTMDNHIASTTAHDANNIVLTSEDPYLTATDVESGLEQISARVSTIIAQSGTSSTEVVDSRTSSTYGVFTTLGNRLNSSDIKLKAVEDEINTQNVGTLALTSNTSIQSVTDSYFGVSDALIGGNTIMNLFNKNKTFSNVGLGLTESSNVYTATTGANATSTALMTLTGGIGISKTNAGKFVQSITTPSSLAGVFLVIGLVGNAQDAARSYTASELLKPSTQYTFYLKVRTLTANSMTFDLAIAEGSITSEFGIIDGALSYGLKSTNKVSILSNGRNLFDGQEFTEGTILGAFLPKAISFTDDVITVVASGAVENVVSYLGTKHKSGQPLYYKYNRSTSAIVARLIKIEDNTLLQSLNTIGSVASYTPTEDCYLEFNYSGTPAVDNIATITEFMISTSTFITYEENKTNQLDIVCSDSTKFELNLLDNLVKNELKQSGGDITAIKNNEAYTLVSSDILSVTPSGLFDFIRIARRIDFKNPTLGLVSDKRVRFRNFINGDFIDGAGYIWNDATSLGVNVPAGTYTDVVAARADLSGDRIIYQLASPIAIPFEDLSLFRISYNGSLVSHDEYTNFRYISDLMQDINLLYPRNLGSSIDGLSNSIGELYSRNYVYDNPTSIMITSGFASGWSGNINNIKNYGKMAEIKLDFLKSADIVVGNTLIYTVPSAIAPIQQHIILINLYDNSGIPVAGSFANLVFDIDGTIKVYPVPSTNLINATRIVGISFKYDTQQ